MVKEPERFAELKSSATMKALAMAKKLESEGKDVVSFDVGEPDFATPESIIKAGVASMFAGDTNYTPIAGSPDLREAIANKLRTENEVQVTSDNVLLVPGGKMAIFEAVMSLIDRGEEVLLLDPAWVSYESIVAIAEGRFKYVPSGEELLMNIGEAITDKTRLIIVNTPSNPTGEMLDKDTVKGIQDLVNDHGLYVISDEIYEKIVYDGRHLSVASGIEDRAIVVNGFSKAYSMTGWRLGYAAAPKEVFARMLKIHQQSATCLPMFIMNAGLYALKFCEDNIKEMVASFKERRDFFIKRLHEIGFEIDTPPGAFYIFLDVEELGPGDQVSLELLNEKYVSTVAGGAFGPNSSRFIRFSYATSMDRIEEGLKRFEDYVKEKK